MSDHTLSQIFSGVGYLLALALIAAVVIPMYWGRKP